MRKGERTFLKGAIGLPAKGSIMNCCLCSNPAKHENMHQWYCKECIKKVSVEAEVWSRVVGYLSPVKRWNKGKKQEWVERTPYQFMDELQVENLQVRNLQGAGMTND